MRLPTRLCVTRLDVRLRRARSAGGAREVQARVWWGCYYYGHWRKFFMIQTL